MIFSAKSASAWSPGDQNLLRMGSKRLFLTARGDIGYTLKAPYRGRGAKPTSKIEGVGAIAAGVNSLGGRARRTTGITGSRRRDAKDIIRRTADIDVTRGLQIADADPIPVELQFFEIARLD